MGVITDAGKWGVGQMPTTIGDVPFMAQKEYEFIRDYIVDNQVQNVLEWGGGSSTLWFPTQAQLKWTTIEHDEDYSKLLAQEVSKRGLAVEVVLAKSRRKYIEATEGEKREEEKREDGYDLILIDGLYRDKCLERAYQLLSDKPHAVIFLHDSGRKAYKEWYTRFPHREVYEGEGWLGDGWDHRGLVMFPNLQGFRETVKASQQISATRLPFEDFRSDANTYHFLLSNNGGVDQESVRLAREVNPYILEQFLSLPKPDIGYGSVPFAEVDYNDSHHMMMSTIIANHQLRYETVVEIGGGFGNMARLNQHVLDFDQWIDIDLPFVLELAQWYLSQTALDFHKFKFINAQEIPVIKSDLVIGAHSLSELCLSDFYRYYHRIVKNSRYFFYSTHLTNCGEEMLRHKLDTISRDFELVTRVESEGGQVYNDLYRKKETKTTK